ncbi:MAG: hypothetical protein WC506_02505 [Candidatus Micrarchaeia archaeon]
MSRFRAGMYYLVSSILLSAAFSAPVLGSLSTALSTFCNAINGIIPIVSMLMVVGGGVIYAAGQLMGAETRARANVWATAMLTGAVIGILIRVVAPSILSLLYAGAYTC